MFGTEVCIRLRIKEAILKIKHYICNLDKTLAYDLIRIYLGIGLFLKGIQFISMPMALSDLMQGSYIQLLPVIILHYIALAHLSGGLMLIFGILTRLAAIIQIPILFGATFFVHLREGILSTQQNFEFSALVLFLLIIYAFFGPGNFSVDRSLSKE